MFRRFMLCALAAAMAIVVAPMGSRAADPKLQELQRDVASLQEQVRLLKESQDKQLAALTVLVQQALDTSNRSTTGVAVIQNNLHSLTFSPGFTRKSFVSIFIALPPNPQYPVSRVQREPGPRLRSAQVHHHHYRNRYPIVDDQIGRAHV